MGSDKVLRVYTSAHAARAAFDNALKMQDGAQADRARMIITSATGIDSLYRNAATVDDCDRFRGLEVCELDISPACSAEVRAAVSRAVRIVPFFSQGSSKSTAPAVKQLELPLDTVSSALVLNVAPGDTLVLTSEHKMMAETIAYIQDYVKKVVPGVQVVILTNGVKLSGIIKATPAAVAPSMIPSIFGNLGRPRTLLDARSIVGAGDLSDAKLAVGSISLEVSPTFGKLRP